MNWQVQSSRPCYRFANPEVLFPFGLVKTPVCLQVSPALAQLSADVGKFFLQRWTAPEHEPPFSAFFDWLPYVASPPVMEPFTTAYARGDEIKLTSNIARSAKRDFLQAHFIEISPSIRQT
jgi:hypothetical protein